MAKIKLFETPFENSYKEFEADSVGEFILDNLDVIGDQRVTVLLDGSDITDDIPRQAVSDECEYHVLLSPGADPITIALVTFVVAIAAVLLTPSIPTQFQNRSQSSPNNDLSNRSNKARPLERVEDIFGTVRAIPSVIMQTYSKFIGHTEFEYGYYCVGRGYYDITDVRDGDTLLSDLTGSKAAFYDPFKSPNSGDSPFLQIGSTIEDDVLTVSRLKQVDGATLKALNQIQLTNPDTYTYSTNTITQSTKEPNFDTVAASGDTVTVTTGNFFSLKLDGVSITAQNSDNSFNVSGPDFTTFLTNGDVVRTSGFATGGNNGTFTVSSVTTSKIVVTGGTLTDETSVADMEKQVNYDGNYEIDTVADGQITLTTSPFTDAGSVSSTVTIDGVSDWSDWFTLPSADRNQVWSNIIAANGMYKDKGDGFKDTSVDFEIEIEEIVGGTPTGTVETINGSINGATQDQRGVTVEQVTAFTGTCRVRARRTTPYDYSYNGTISDEIKWRDLYSVSPVSKTNFGNKTTVHTVVKATERATSVQDRELNCLASRKIPTYDGTSFSGTFDSSGALASGTISASSKLIDIIAAVCADSKIGNMTLANEVDVNQIYSVQQTLDAWGSTYGTFNHTFDSDQTSVEEILATIATAGFCRAYRQNGKIRLALDVAQTNPSQIFTHRNKRPDSETITRIFEPDHNAVKFTYVDSVTEKREEIILGTGTRVKTVDSEGVTDFSQAWLLANREFNRLKYGRLTINFESTADGRNLLPNTLIDVVDDTRYKSYGGEVVGKSGLTLTLSQPVKFTSGESHSIILMKRDGSIESIVCTAGTSSNQVILASEPAETVVTDYSENGIRTIYSFASDSTRNAQRYLVTETAPDSSGEYVTITAINYSDSYYTADNQSIPDKTATLGL